MNAFWAYQIMLNRQSSFPRNFNCTHGDWRFWEFWQSRNDFISCSQVWVLVWCVRVCSFSCISICHTSSDLLFGNICIFFLFQQHAQTAEVSEMEIEIINCWPISRLHLDYRSHVSIYCKISLFIRTHRTSLLLWFYTYSTNADLWLLIQPAMMSHQSRFRHIGAIPTLLKFQKIIQLKQPRGFFDSRFNSHQCLRIVTRFIWNY